MPEDFDADRRWTKAGEDPLRFEYGRENETPGAPRTKEQLAFVEEEKHSSYFHWETYTSHEKGAKPGQVQAGQHSVRSGRAYCRSSGEGFASSRHFGAVYLPQRRTVGETIRGLILIAEVLSAEEMWGHVEFL